MKLRGDLVDMFDGKLAFMYILEIVAAILAISVSLRVVSDPEVVSYSDIANYYANQSLTYIENDN